MRSGSLTRRRNWRWEKRSHRKNTSGARSIWSQTDPDPFVKVDGKDITLTLKEFETLCLLLQNKGIVLTRDQLLNKIWGYSFDGESRTVDVHIRTLRQKLQEAGSVIKTIRGVGYKI